MKSTTVKILLLLLGILYSQAALTHEEGITDTGIQISRDSLKLTYTVPQALVDTLSTDATLDNNAAQSQAILNGLSVLNAQTTCLGRLNNRKSLDTIGSEQFNFTFDCKQPITELNLTYNLFFDQDSKHSNIVRVSLLGTHQDNTLSKDNRLLSIDVESVVRRLADIRNSAKSKQTSPPAAFEKPFGTQYFTVGFWHILLGYDHVLFLICLVLLPMRPLVILSLITSFTVAHSITLSLSVLDIVTLKPQLVEAIIALSIVYVSVRTIAILRRSDTPHISKSQIKERVLSSFLFGLVHGFGFSYLLKEIGFGDQILSSLLFFNIGVEAGQLAILTLLLPLIWWLGKRYSSWRWARAISGITALFGLFWFIERIAAM